MEKIDYYRLIGKAFQQDKLAVITANKVKTFKRITIKNFYTKDMFSLLVALYLVKSVKHIILQEGNYDYPEPSYAVIFNHKITSADIKTLQAIAKSFEQESIVVNHYLYYSNGRVDDLKKEIHWFNSRKKAKSYYSKILGTDLIYKIGKPQD